VERVDVQNNGGNGNDDVRLTATWGRWGRHVALQRDAHGGSTRHVRRGGQQALPPPRTESFGTVPLF
jgi:hypothetical protein